MCSLQSVCPIAVFAVCGSAVRGGTWVSGRWLPSRATEALWSRPAIEPAPRATLARPFACEPAPSAVAPSAVANALSPSDVLLSPLDQLFQPIAVASPPVAHAPLPTAADPVQPRRASRQTRARQYESTPVAAA